VDDERTQNRLDRRDALAALFYDRKVFGNEDSRASIARDLAQIPVEELVDAIQAGPVGGPRFRFLSDTELEALERPDELIEEAIPERALGALFGPPGSGKSFLVLDWAMCIELGIKWAGGRQARLGHVVYVLAEGATTLGPRISAWKHFFGVEGTVGVSFVTEPVPLMDPAVVSTFIRDLNDAVPESPSLIVFDTLARCMAGGDENSARDMGALIAGADRIRNELGCAVLLVHHTNKSGESERGSTALRGAVDTLLSLKMTDDGTVRLSCEKQKDAAPFKPIELQLKPHLDSVILTAISPMSVKGDELTPTVLETLTLLTSHAPPEGLSTSKWAAVSEKNERTFYRHLNRLIQGGYVDKAERGGGVIYSVSEKGREVLTCH